MTSYEVLLRMTEKEPGGGKWGAIERYAGVLAELAELERMLSDREMDVLVEAGAQLVRLSYPEVFRTVQI